MGDYTPGIGAVSGSGTLANRPAAGSVITGYLYFVTSGPSIGNLYESDGVSAWTQVAAGVGTSPVTSVAGRTGAVVLAVADVSGAEATANKGIASGYAGLGANVLVPQAQLGTGSGGGGSKFLADDQTYKSVSASLGPVSAKLGADVTLVNAATWYDGPSIALTAGTWFVVAYGECTTTAGGTVHHELRLYDGTTVWGSNEGWADTGRPCPIPVAGLVVAAGAVTLKLQAACDSGGSASKLVAATTNNGVGNNACGIQGFQAA